ncbi:MAG: hypothetical protein LBL66_06305 [Clostridiales bacterium]|jgi:multidrug transporter EmrE-like cation transporter|nr:hypothetical protein [Clostridiales bacterium]
MDYMYAVLAPVAVAAQFTFTKSFQKRFEGVPPRFFFMLASAAACVLMFLCLNGFAVRYGTFTFFMALGEAATVAVYTVIGFAVFRLGSLSVYMIFLMLGAMLLPYACGVAFLGEEPAALNIVGLAVLVVSMFVPFVQGKRAREGAAGGRRKKTRKLYIVLCVAVFLLNGLTVTISKLHQSNPWDAAALSAYDFFFWYGCFAACLSAAAYAGFYLIRRFFLKEGRQASAQKEKGAAEKEKSGGAQSDGIQPDRAQSDGIQSSDAQSDRAQSGGAQREMPAEGNFMGVPRRRLWSGAALAVGYTVSMGVGAVLQFAAATTMDASVLFPIVTGGTIVLSAVSGAVFFHEKITVPIWISLGLTAVGTVLFLF